MKGVIAQLASLSAIALLLLVAAFAIPFSFVSPLDAVTLDAHQVPTGSYETDRPWPGSAALESWQKNTARSVRLSCDSAGCPPDATTSAGLAERERSTGSLRPPAARVTVLRI